jgi:hypothetical protein
VGTDFWTPFGGGTDFPLGALTDPGFTACAIMFAIGFLAI